MTKVSLIDDEVIDVDEQTALLLARLQVAFVHVVVEGGRLSEAEFNSLAIYVLSRLKVLALRRNVEDGVVYHLRNREKMTTGVFRTLCDLLEARIRAVKACDGSFLRLTAPVQRRLERRLHLSETF